MEESNEKYVSFFSLHAGRLTDLTGSYKAVIPTSMVFLIISFIAFNTTIILSSKKKINETEQNEVYIL